MGPARAGGFFEVNDMTEIPMIRVHALINSAILTAWSLDNEGMERQQYLDSTFYALNELKVDPESIYVEEGTVLQELVNLEHLEDRVRSDGAWLCYGEPAERYFILQWYEKEGDAWAKAESVIGEEGVRCFVVDLSLEGVTPNADRNG